MPIVWPETDRPWIMGIVNVTPDSFSDGGLFLSAEDAVSHGCRLIMEGADILDVGGESTRPGSIPVNEAEQLRRVTPVIGGIRRRWDGPISIDTTRASVASGAFESGANWVNDISALRDDPAMAPLVARLACPVVLMHMLGTPRTMQVEPSYDDVVTEVRDFLTERVSHATTAGVSPRNIILDPGIGFGKTVGHNLALLRHLSEIAGLGYPVLVGASRKSFIGQIIDAPVGERLAGSLAAAILAANAGATILRVHDVSQTRQALKVARAISGR